MQFQSLLWGAHHLARLRYWKLQRAQANLFASDSKMARRLPTTNPQMESASWRRAAGIAREPRDRAAPPFSWARGQLFTARLGGKASAVRQWRSTTSVARIRGGMRSPSSSQESFP